MLPRTRAANKSHTQQQSHIVVEQQTHDCILNPESGQTPHTQGEAWHQMCLTLAAFLPAKGNLRRRDENGDEEGRNDAPRCHEALHRLRIAERERESIARPEP